MRAHTRFKAVQHIAKLSTVFSNEIGSTNGENVGVDDEDISENTVEKG